MSAKHSEQTAADGIHIVHAFEYADAAARTGATGLTAADVGKVSKQIDALTWWVLTNHSPVTWKELTSSGTVPSHATSHQDGGSDEINVGGLSGLLADPQTPASHTHVEADITDLTHTDTDAIHDNVSGEIAAITLVAAAAADHLLIEDASDSNNKKRVTAQSVADLAGSGLPAGHVNGLGVSINATNPTFQIDVAAGKCRDDADSFNINNTATKTADITVSGANGLDTGSEAASTWYSVWIIAKSSDGTTAALLSTSATSPTMPAGYDKKRRVGWVRNNSTSDFINFSSLSSAGRDRHYRYDNINENIVQVLDAATATTFTDVNLANLIPPNAVAVLLAVYDGEGFPDYVIFRPDGATEATPPFRVFGGDGSTVFAMRAPGGIIEYENAAATDDTYLWVVGYIDSI